MKILLTGGAGYIGSHIAVELLNNDIEVCVADNLCNANAKSLQRVEEITGKKVTFYQADIRDKAKLEEIFAQNDFYACIHCAGLKAVGESVAKPLQYYDNNIAGTIKLLQIMQKYNCKKIVFSSSATVYGAADKMPITENTLKKECTNPYGRTKSMIEQILTDLYEADKDWGIMILRYFNPIGAHESGKIGENPNGIPNNLMPFITQTAAQKREILQIFGNDYPTNDGTCIRDYIHVTDLAKGHLKALENLQNGDLKIYNLGTGKGCSVLELVRAFEKVNNLTIPFKIAPRREGDVAVCYACADKAEQELGWKAEKTIEDMCRDAWRWQKNNPNGYD